MEKETSAYERYLKGDDEALVKIVEEYKDGLILFINGFVHNIHIAEELCEETFFRLIIKKPRFFWRSSFKSWLYAIARNISIDYLRRNARYLNASYEDLENHLKSEEDLEASYFKKEDKLILHKALKRLKSEYETALYLVYFEGFTNKEAAKILKKSDKDIRNILYRAKKALKKELLKEGFSYEDLFRNKY